MKNRQQPRLFTLEPRWQRIFYWGIVAIFVSAPLLTPLVVWLGSQFGYFDAFKLGKELVLVTLVGSLLALLVAQPKLRQLTPNNGVLLLIAGYVLLTVMIASWDMVTGRVAQTATIFGLIVNLRFLAFFCLVYILYSTVKLKPLPWQKLLLVPAAVVIGFGLLQFVLPIDSLSHIGYNQHTTYEPYETVDNNPELARIQSTLRGPNPLGAYLVVIITFLVLLGTSLRAAKERWIVLITGLSAVAVLFGTYSRSAWLGVIISLIVAGFYIHHRHLPKQVIGIGAFLLVGSGLVVLLALRDHPRFQNIIFHTSSQSTSAVTSNEQRAGAIKEGVRYVENHPLGGGVGSAGPASARNGPEPPRIAENYYLQIAQESGWLGLGLFVAIQVLVGRELWRRRQQSLALGLVASLAGITAINLLSHAWTDDTLAYVWWGLAGLALAAPQNGKR